MSFIVLNFAWNTPLVSLIFLKRSLFFPTVVFLYFFCIDHWGRLSYHSLLFFGTLYSNGFIFPFLLCLSLLFFSQLFVRPCQTTILLFCIYFTWGWSWSLLPVQYHEPSSIFLQALSLSDLIPWIYFLLPLCNCKGFDLGHSIKLSTVFLYFLQFKSEFGNKEFMIWATVSSQSDCLKLLHFWLWRI